ncbi:MAG: MBG domain-containing protein, partial [Paludibacter sp.]
MKRTILLLAVLPFFSFALMAADPILTTKDLSTTPAIAAFNLNYLTGTRKITNNTSFAPTTDYTVEVKAKILSAAVKGFFLETRDAGRNGFRMSINSSGVDNYGALNYTNETAITNVSAVANDAATYHIFRFAVAGTNVHIYRDGAYITSTTTQGIYKDNLLKDNNGNFESTDVSMWNFILAGQGRTTTAGEFNTGAGAVKIKNTGTSTVQSQLTIKGLKPSTSYGFSFYAKYLAKTVNAGNMKYELKLGNYNGSGVFVQTNSGNINNNIVGTPTNTMAAASAVWTLNTQTFSTGAADSIAILDISGWNGDNTYVIDDMVLNETEVTPTVGAATGSNLITNGTFATNITGWSTTASWPFGSIAWASGGGGQLQVIEAPWAGPSNGTYTSSITVSPNKTYKLTAKTSHQNAATQSVTLTDGLVNASTSYSAAAAYAANNITTPALSTIPSTTSLSMKFTTKTGHRTPGQVIMTLDDVILSEYVATYPTYLSYGKAFQSEAANFDIGYINYDVTGAYGPLNYVIAASSSGNGTVSGAATYTAGATVSLTATANSGYSFVDWTEGGSHVSSNATYSFTASAGRTLVANFIAVLTVTGTLSPFSSTYGTASTTQSFTVAGSNLTSDIIVTPPTGFEVSLTSGSGYLSSVTLTQALGSVATTTVYVRLKATAPAATYSAANITINTTGSNQNLSCSGTVATITPNIAFATITSVSKNFGDVAFTNAATSSNSAGAVSYSSGNTAVATVNATSGLVTIESVGSAIITANIATAGNYSATLTTYTLNVAIGNPTLAFTTLTSVSKIIGDAAFTNAASSNFGGPISYISGNTAVATVDASTGLVTIVSAGSAIITANIAATVNYNASSTTYTVYTYNSALFRDNFESYANSANLRTVTIPTYGGSYDDWWISGISVQPGCYLNSKGAKLNGKANASVYMRKTITVTAGHTYTFSALTWCTSTINSLGYEFLTSKVSGGSGSPTIANTWIPQTVTFTAATSENVDVFVYSWVAEIFSDDWLVVDKTPTVTPTVGTYTYTGSAQGPNAATNTGTGTSYTYSYAGVNPTVYTASSTQPTTAGTYTVIATVAADGNYTQASSSATAFTIGKATPTLSVSNSPATYDGTAKSATATALGGGLVSSITTGGTATQTNAGTYTVTADIAASTNYNAATGVTASNSFVIDKATPTLTVSNSPVTYDGTAKSATATASGSGVVSNILTGGAATQTTAGTYTITANIAASTNYNSATGVTASNSFVISKATPTLTVSNTPVTYDGTGKSATATASGSGVVSNISTGGAATQTTAGTYTVTADITASTNYNAATSVTASNSFVISKAIPTLTVSNTPVTYDGTGKSATATASGSGVVSNISTGGAATQTNAGTYTVTADIAASTNYNAATGLTATSSFVIDKATPTLTVTNTPVTYDGTAKSATASASESGVVSNILTGGAATQTTAGTYTVTADIAASTNYNAA